MKNLLQAGIIIAIISFLSSALGAHEATLRISSHFENTMVYVEEDEREEYVPEWETVTVKKGDEVGELEILSVTANAVTFQTYFEYAGTAYVNERFDHDCGTGTRFTIHRGETLRLVEVGLLDATSTTTIVFE